MARAQKESNKKARRTKAAKEPNKGGRPTDWKPEYNQAIIDFFSGEPYDTITIVSTGKNDFRKEEPQRVPNRLPTLTRFAEKIGVSRDTLHEWAKPDNKDKYPGFSDAFTRAKELYKDFLIANGLEGLYDSRFAIFVAKNTTDMKDKVETEHSGDVALTLKGLFDELRKQRTSQDSG